MKLKKPTVTIGIPAFNEEANIAILLHDLLAQKASNFKISQIMVASDGSTDKTVKEVKSLKSRLIKVFDFKDRKGRAERQTYMMKAATTDIFVLLDADMGIPDPKFIGKLIQPMIKSNVDLVSGNLLPQEADNFFEKILFVSMYYKRSVFENFNKGDNLFTCYGPMRAFSKRLYTKIEFKTSVAEDMYSYYFCKFNGFSYASAKDAIAFFKLPNKFSDYRKQSTRYWSSAYLYEEFGEAFIKSHYFLPKWLFLVKGLETFFKYPLYAPFYPILPLFTRIESFFSKSGSENTWSIAASSKVASKTALQVKGGQRISANH